jgi:hypothetical protein
MGLKLLLVTRFGFILAVIGVFSIVISYFTNSDFISGMALLIIGIAIFIVDSSIKPSQRH